MEVARLHPAKGIWGGGLLLLVGIGLPFVPALLGQSYEEVATSSRRGAGFIMVMPLVVLCGVGIGSSTLWELISPRHPSISIRDGRIRFRQPWARSIPLAEIEDVEMVEWRDPLDRTIVKGIGVKVVLKDGVRRTIGTRLYRQTAYEIRQTLLAAAGLPSGA